MSVAAGMIDMPTRPAIGTGFDMPAEHGRAAGENGPPDLGCATWQIMAGKIGRTEGGEHLGQAGRCHAGGSVGLKEFEGRGRPSQPRLRQMEVTHGRADMAVAEEALDGVDINAGFEQMGGEGVAQGVDAAVVG